MQWVGALAMGMGMGRRVVLHVKAIRGDYSDDCALTNVAWSVSGVGGKAHSSDEWGR
jgi:hypothetical protein